MRIVEGQILQATEFFTDDYGDPLYPKMDNIGPIVTVYDEHGDRISSALSTVGEAPGSWDVSLSIPDMELLDEKSFKLSWIYMSDEGKVTINSELIVEPAQDNRITDLVCTISETSYVRVNIPVKFEPSSDRILISVSLNNEPLIENLPHTHQSMTLVANRAKSCTLQVPLYAAPARLEPMSLIATYESDARQIHKMFTYKMWAVTPQILLAASMVEDHINKARMQNVIPELEYTQADLIQYLFRGLALFNQIGPRVTGFFGTNMRGTLLDGWVTCSCYYALAAQLQAEGQLAFDFTGQVTNLNMDRTPSIEAALGRIETQIQGPITNLKRLLSKAGINEGDGSIGANQIDGSRGIGRLGVINAPTSKWASMGNRSIWVNTRYKVSR